MKFLLIEPFSGASGDMFLGALLDLGVPVADVERALRTLPIGGWSLGAERVRRRGIAATKARVALDALGGREEGYATAHAHHGPPGDDHGHGHRTPGEIFDVIARSELPAPVKDRARSVFQALAVAEGRVHGMPPESVRFHEVGATDAIVDVCGSVLGLHALGVERVYATTATTGFGLVRCAHGVVPAPAPATVFLMEGRPVTPGPVEGELLTPTGAALLSTLVTDWGLPPPYVAERSGFGAGNSDWAEVANVLRMTVARATAGGEESVGQVLEAEFDVDDMRGKDLAWLREALVARGALDVVIAPVGMKKGRPGHKVTVLFPRASATEVESAIFRESTTFGFRVRAVERRTLDRAVVRVDTPYGAVRVKVGRHGGEVVQVRPEYEDVAAAARASGRTLAEVEAAALAAFKARGGA